MKLDLDKIIDACGPPRVTLTYQGADYPLRRLSVADVAGLDLLAEARDGETQAAHLERLLNHLRGVFDGDAPAFLSPTPEALSDPAAAAALVTRVSAVSAAVGATIVEAHTPGNRMARAMSEATSQIATQIARAGSGAGSD